MKIWPKNLNKCSTYQINWLLLLVAQLISKDCFYDCLAPPMMSPPGVAGAPRASLRHWRRAEAKILVAQNMDFFVTLTIEFCSL